MVKYGYWDGLGMVPGIALPVPTRSSLPRVHPSPTGYSHDRACGAAARVEEVVGLRSVAQLTLGVHFSGFRGITEGYNLDIAENPNDHNCIPGNK